MNLLFDRRCFLRKVAVGAAATAAGISALSAVSENGAEATPSGERMLIGHLDQALNVRARLCEIADAVCVHPRLLNDGTFALSATAMEDPKYSAAANMLSTWQLRELQEQDYYSQSTFGDPTDFVFLVDGKLMRQAGRPSSLTMPYPQIFRFEVREDDFAGPYDSAVGNRRSEIVSHQRHGIGEGTIWSSFCLVLGEVPNLIDAGHGIIHQWHSVDTDVGRSPTLFVDVSKGKLSVSTCSSSRLYGDTAVGKQRPANGIPVCHYSVDVPSPGEKAYIVLQAKFGRDGHLDVWINGNRAVDVDTPIGYYDDLIDGSGRTILGYPHWGLYTTNQPDTNTVHIANPEWGIGSLIARVTTPLPVPDLL